MLEDQDIKQIRGVVKEEVSPLREDIGELGEAIQALSSHVDQGAEESEKGLHDQIGKFRSELIDHVSRTVNDAKGDIIQILKTDRERFKMFNSKVLTILGRNKLAEPEEAEAMRELVI